MAGPWLKEALDGHRVIKVFNAQDPEAREFEKVNELNRRSNMKLIAARAVSKKGNPSLRVASIAAATRSVALANHRGQVSRPMT